MDKRLGKNLFLNVAYHILSLIVPFITAPYLGRVLEVENIGTYTYVQSISSYFVLFGTLGLSNYGNRCIAKVREDQYLRSKCFWEIYSMQLITSATAFLFYICYVLFFVSESRIYFCTMILYIAAMFVDAGWYFLGMEKFKVIVIRNVCIKVINLVSIFVFVKKQTDLLKYFIILAGGQMISQLSFWPAVLSDIQWVKPSWRNVKEHFKPNIMLFVPVLAASIYNIMDKVMIGAISSKSDLAYYDYANKIVEIPNIAFGAMGTVMLSRMSSLKNKNKNTANDLIGYSIDISCFIAIGAMFGILAIATELVTVYYGNAFLPSAIILKLLCIVIPLYAWSNVIRIQYIIPESKDIVYITATVCGAVVNLIANFILIPQMSSTGAAIGTLLAQLAVTIVFVKYAKNELPLMEYVIRNAPLLLSGLVMLCVIKTFQKIQTVSASSLILNIMIGIMTYVVTSVIFMRSQEKHFINVVIQKIKNSERKKVV